MIFRKGVRPPDNLIFYYDKNVIETVKSFFLSWFGLNSGWLFAEPQVHFLDKL